MKKLKGKVAFITGGSRGMGAAIAKQLAADGADVIFTHSGNNRSKADSVLEAIEAEGVKARSFVANSEKPNELLAALQATSEQFGRLDILVNNAGIYSDKVIADTTMEEFDEIVSVNVKAVFIASRYAAQHMNDGGRIITIGSNMASRVAHPGGSLYSMSKSALIGLTKGMARDIGNRRITVNLVQPGPIDTDMNPATAPHAPILINEMAIKRYGSADEIASLISYLAGPASEFITGTTITIDGGFNI